MAIIGSIIVPHPPLLIPEVGRGQEQIVAATAEAYRAAAAQVAAWQPDTLVLATPHAIVYEDYFHIAPGGRAFGDMTDFRAPQVRMEVVYDEALRAEIVEQAAIARLSAGTLGERTVMLDHGSFIPLYFLREAGVECPIVRVALSGCSPLEHYKLGQCIAEAAKEKDKRVVFIASGDLSHRLKADSPYGFAPEGPVFDKQVTDVMRSGSFLEWLCMEQQVCSNAAECGLRAFQMMAGALDGLAVEPRLLSYEGPFGVGYAVATFAVTGEDETRKFVEPYEAWERERFAQRRTQEDPWVRLARLALESYVRKGRELTELPEDLPSEMTERAAGVFVSLHANGRLRGCIGTIAPVTPSVAKEIVRNAVCAGTEDPRFSRVTPRELDRLTYKVDVLGEPEPIYSAAELDVKRYGVIVSSGNRRGLLLPDLKGVDTVEQQIAIAREKAGISSGEPYRLERFEVVRHA